MSFVDFILVLNYEFVFWIGSFYSYCKNSHIILGFKQRIKNLL